MPQSLESLEAIQQSYELLRHYPSKGCTISALELRIGLERKCALFIGNLMKGSDEAVALVKRLDIVLFDMEIQDGEQ
jgi:hypothetical protein